MKKNELISMVDFALTCEARKDNDPWEYANSVLNYAEFLNTPLNISMFVPAIKVGDKWEVLEMPEYRDTKGMSNAYSIDFNLGFDEAMEEYQTAKEQCLFEGDFTRNHIKSFAYHISRDRTIEYLVPFDITLTKKGVEVSGLNR
tara:strand:+ start:2147 stop:2578 length:432 start_codon:yes stop_codon:yes gene_type:complete